MDFNPKLVAFDLDGTLAESKTPVTSRMGQLLAELLQKMPVAVMSGGSFVQFETQLLPALPPDAHLDRMYLFPTSAARCLKFLNGTWQNIYDNSLTLREREHILEVLKEALALNGLGEPPPHVWGERIEDRGTQITFSGLGQLAPIEEKKKWDPDKKKRAPVQEYLIEKLPDFSIAVNAATSIDITRKGITKAYGIRQLAGLTDISVSEMLYVGDALDEGGNDYVVVETGVRTQKVFGPVETAKVIGQILHPRAKSS